MKSPLLDNGTTNPLLGDSSESRWKNTETYICAINHLIIELTEIKNVFRNRVFAQ